MLLTTTNSVEDYKIMEYKGIVSGTAVNVQKMTMTFNMQKHYDGVSQSIADVKEQALEQLRQNAEKINATAVVGILVDIEVKSSEYLIVATVTGTAVSIIKR